MIFNVAFDNEHMQYAQEYETSQQFSPHFQTFARQLATRLIKEYDLRGKEIIEIGCGQGDFLSLFCEGTGNKGVGFDPGYDPKKAFASRSSDIIFIRDFYTEAYSDFHADFICCRHVLEHVPSPRDFLFQLRRICTKDTVVYFEVPNTLYTLRDMGIWDVLYEHCAYFTRPSLSRLFTETGFCILRLYEAYEGQFLCIEAVPKHFQWISGLPPIVSEVIHLIPPFADRHRKKVNEWTNALRGYADSGKRVAVWGAGSKGVTFLNVVQGGYDKIQHVIDISPRKQGRHVPGTGQRVASPKELIHSQPDLIIVMNGVYQEEIYHMTRDMHTDARLLAA
jgi:ubiquinone/menaquinone biosynthesis C-methylase UbiE